MIFTDVRFFVLFVLCWISFFALPRRMRGGVLAFWGIAFYALYAGRALFIVAALVALTFLARFRKFLAWLAGSVIVATLAYYKSAYLLPSLPLSGAEGIVVPLGLSYLSFELLHVIIERRRGRLLDVATADLLAFAFFAPARIAGPIKRFPQFTGQVRDAELSFTNVYAGLVRIVFGLFKKFVLADILVLGPAGQIAAASAKQAWAIVFAYALQIYFDFSAYSDIAIGFARVLGIRLPENFRNPYASANIREFWERWHITLSQWVRDYVFTPLGRLLFRTRLRPRPLAIASICYVVTFAVVGAWHGVTAGFLIWGLYHGVLLMLYNIIRTKMPASIIERAWYDSRWTRMAGVAATFFFVVIGWVPFMLPWPEAGKMLLLMFGGGA